MSSEVEKDGDVWTKQPRRCRSVQFSRRAGLGSPHSAFLTSNFKFASGLLEPHFLLTQRRDPASGGLRAAQVPAAKRPHGRCSCQEARFWSGQLSPWNGGPHEDACSLRPARNGRCPRQDAESRNGKRTRCRSVTCKEVQPVHPRASCFIPATGHRTNRPVGVWAAAPGSLPA